MSWPTNDPYGSSPTGDPSRQPPMAGPTDPAPWATPPSPIPSYVPPAPGQSQGPQDRLTGAPAPQPAPQPRPQLRYADWGERVGATLVDWTIILGPVIALGAITDEADDFGGLVWLALAAYVAWLNGSKGQSPGKALMGIKLVRDADGSTLGGPVGLVRSLVLLLMFGFSAGLLWALALVWPVFSARKQALHDKMFSASVVAGYPRAKFGPNVLRP